MSLRWTSKCPAKMVWSFWKRMETRPIPVVMLSTLTQKGADVSIKAIELGAVDCFPKPQKATPDEFKKITGKLCKTVLTASKSNMEARAAARQSAPAHAIAGYAYNGEVLAVAGGMGAMDAVTEMLAAFPADCPPTLVALDMEEGLAVPFASRLNKAIGAEVKIAAEGADMVPGVVYIAADPNHHVVIDRWPHGKIRLIDRDPVNGCRPSADLLFASVAKTAGAKGRGVILSGGGQDGAAGLAAMIAGGGMAMGQSPDTALVDEAIQAARAKGLTVLLNPQALGAALLNGVVAHAA